MRKTSLRIVTVVLLVLTAHCYAATDFLDSLETMVAKSTVIARGKPIATETNPGVPNQYERSSKIHMVVSVSEVFMGPATVQLNVLIDVEGYVQDADDWLASHEERILFLKSESPRLERPLTSSEQAAADAYPLRFGPRLPRCGDKPFAICCDFRALKSEDDIEKALRAEIREHGKPVAGERSVPATKPAEVAFAALPESGEMVQLLQTGSLNYLMVPCDARMERIAQRWCEEEKGILGVPVLSQLKSPRNIELLKKALTDRSGAIDYFDTTTFYPARADAFKTLRSWGVDVPEPVTVNHGESYKR